ncbi:DoxX family protein [Mucilaginibacter sp. BJC16-A38]|uniref:DoxX family protein n=1 Tax=Mucilaginibacter phenanthrenivorans TaxID=1234842 RepID=UPI0021588A9B|nr:DoxX family protein [Mucilaginibacter phenanthrenivorans]MCR8560850.1 DoxX family protein [Mucilaginibacter phenanthrenivorans]
MNTFIWALQVVLAAFFIMPGVGKITGSRESHIADGHIKPDGNLRPIRILGVLELLGCVGIIVPWLTGIASILTPITAVCYCMIMVAGIINHTIKKEYKMLPMLIAVLIASSLVAYYRFS